MASGIFGISLSGLSAAQAGLRVTQQNIANVNTPGYHRQEVVFTEKTPSIFGNTWIGNGVDVETVRRSYSQFLDNEVLRGEGAQTYHQAYATQASQVDSLLGSADSGMADSMNAFFDAANEVANDPTATAPRQTLLASGENLAGRVRTLYSRLQQQMEDSNTAVDSLVTRINTYAQQIASLNESIVNMQAPNDLVDQRDQVIADLNRLVNVTTEQQGEGRVNVFIGNGLALVAGDQASTFTVPSPTAPDDPYHSSPAPVLPQLNTGTSSVLMDGTRLTGGELGGVLAQREQVLQPAMSSLNRLAVAIGTAVNQVHNGGAHYDSATNTMVAGGDFFSGAVNQTAGSNWIGVSFTSNPLANENYTVSYDGTDYTVTRLSDGASADFAAGAEVTLGGEAQGFAVTPGVPAPVAGNAWTLDFQDYAHDMAMAIGQASEIAAASSTANGPGDNGNALALADLRGSRLLDNGATTLFGANNMMANTVAAKTAEADVNSRIFETLTSQAKEAQQSYSGVNLDEEAVNLIRYQQAYQAAAKALSIANSLFDSILAIG